MIRLPWRRKRLDDTGSMPVALLVTMIGVTLSAGTSGMVVAQIGETKRIENRARAVASAQAGLDEVLAKIRSSTKTAVDNTTGNGDLAKLPCSPITSTVGDVKFNTQIAYFSIDPAGLVEGIKEVGDLNNLATLAQQNLLTPLTGLVNRTLTLAGQTIRITEPLTTALSGLVTCVGIGLTPPRLLQTPRYGLLRSTGTFNGVQRTVYATYAFQDQEKSIPGDRILPTWDSPGPLCVAAKGASSESPDPVWKAKYGRLPKVSDPMNPAYVVTVGCTNPAFDPWTIFVYTLNMELRLKDTITDRYPYGLCVTQPSDLGAPAHLEFQECDPLAKRVTQKWEYDVNAQTYYGLRTNATTLKAERNGYCWNKRNVTSTPNGWDTVVLVKNENNQCGRPNIKGRSMVPGKKIGAGAAGLNLNQYVNKGEVGSCLDLTNQNPTWGGVADPKHPPSLIAYPCKQSPSADQVAWNHKWFSALTKEEILDGKSSDTGPFFTLEDNNTGKKWCLQSSGAVGGWVWVYACTGGANQNWKVHAATGSVKTAYQITDSAGRCLEASGFRGGTYRFTSTVGYISTQTCDGSDAQKWNSPPTLEVFPLRAIQEK